MSTDNEDNTDFSKASTALVDDVFVSSKDSNDEVTCTPLSSLKPFSSSNEDKRKLFLKGYRHKITGVSYHNISTQTIKPPWNYGAAELFTRDSQTVETKNQSQQTSRNISTQVEVRNIFIQTSSDKLTLPSNEFISTDEIQAENLSKVIYIQRYVRRWLAQKELKRLQQNMLEKLTWEEEQKKVREKQDLDWFRDLQRRKLYPITEDDFLLHFSDLQNWWESEVEVISKSKCEEDQPAAMWELVNEEAKKVSEINKLKTAVKNEKSFHQRQKNLIEASKPKLWKGYKKEILVTTDSTQKGRKLQDLYMTLSMKCISAQDRIVGLQSLIQLIQNNNSALTSTILQLAEREIDLLLRGTRVQNLEGLRSRVQDLFWQYIKQPAFNPQPNMKKVGGKKPHILCCAGCKQFYALPPNSVNEVISKGVMGNCFTKCKKCLYLETEGWIRKDNELYKKILKFLIDEEKRKTPLSSIIYMLQ